MNREPEYRSQDFVVDGSMRDVCVLDADLPTWQAVFDGLSRTGWQVSFTATFEKTHPEALSNAEAFFDKLGLDDEASATLAILVDHIWFTCYFFDVEEIEFTFHTEDVASAASFDSLMTFVRWLGNTCDKRVIVTMESSTDHQGLPALVEYSPGSSK